MSEGQSPTVRRRRLGMELRRLREAAYMTIEDLAHHLECSTSRVSRIETGKTVARSRDVRDMLDLYRLTDDKQRADLLTIAKQAQQKGWWSKFEGALEAGLDTYLGLEASAASLRMFQANLLTGLLQTEEYARAVVTAAQITDPKVVEHLIAVRMRRQELLTKPDPPELWAVADEAVLRRPIGGPAIMRAQLMRLAEMAELPNVRLQVLPFARGSHAGLDGPFTIISFPDPTDLDVVYIPSPAWNIFVERVKDVRRRALCFDLLRAEALPPDESVEFIVAAADQFKSI
jgi:transcriptional regulator with XRE-family HTH domain